MHERSKHDRAGKGRRKRGENMPTKNNEIYKNAKRLESALLEYIEDNVKDTTPEIAATIPSVAMVLIELWKTI